LLAGKFNEWFLESFRVWLVTWREVHFVVFSLGDLLVLTGVDGWEVMGFSFYFRAAFLLQGRSLADGCRSGAPEKF